MDDDTIGARFHNLNLEHTREHAARAVMERVLLIFVGHLLTWKNEWEKAKWINFVGGGAISRTWSQIVTDVLNREIRRIENPRETGIRGAAIIATVALGIYKDFPIAAKQAKVAEILKPKRENVKLYDELFKPFKNFTKAIKTFTKIKFKNPRIKFDV